MSALARFIAGSGPQPAEGIISEICETFNCIPNIALQLDPRLVFAILDYRNAKAAKQLHNTDVKEMAKYPDLVKLWKEMFTMEEQGD